VGFGNALRVGDPPISPMSVGTINILCHVSTPLTDGGLLEVMSLVAEARTVAVLAHRVRSTVTGQLATGTGTDCIAVSCPATGAEPTNYAGKHTLIGHLVGQATLEAVSPC
jgi:adenosylcobinamide amidohydrolase